MARFSRIPYLFLLYAVALAPLSGAAQNRRINFDDLGGNGVRPVVADRYRDAGLHLESNGAGVFVFGPSPFAASAPDWLYSSQTAAGGNADANLTLRFVSPLDGTPAVTDDVSFSIADGDHVGSWSVHAYDINNSEVALVTGTAASRVHLTGKVFHRVEFRPSADFEGIDSLEFTPVAAPGTIGFTTFVPFGKPWRWLHPLNNADPALGDSDFHTTWRVGGAAYNGPAFSGPSPSPLGYGTLDLRAIATNIGTPASGSRHTAYFTTTFEVENADRVRTLALDLLADDGAFIYLNGQLVARHNMPASATDTYRQTADGVDINGISTEQAIFTLLLDPSALITGTNFLAVSLHNDSASSSDLGLDLRITGSIATVPEPSSAVLLLLASPLLLPRLCRWLGRPTFAMEGVKIAGFALGALLWPATSQAQTPSLLSAPFHLIESLPQMPVVNPPTSGNFSGVTYSPITDSLFIIDNGASHIYEYDLHGAYRRTITTSGFEDPEGIVWMEGSRFAFVEEKTTHINIVNLTPTTTSVQKSQLPLSDIIRPDLNPADPSAGALNPTGGNTGIEGLAYNADQNLFYLLKEKAEGTPGDHAVNIFAVQPSGVASVLFNPSVPQGGALSSLVSLATDAADLHYDRATGHLLVLSHESRRTIEVTTAGEVVASRAQPGTQIEGVTLTPDGKHLYVVGESREFFHYETSPHLTALVPPGATWKFRDDGINLGTFWRLPEFNDAAWSQGAAEFGYGDADERTIVRCGPVAGCTSSNQPTTYFRHAFSVDDPQNIEELTLGILRDDGAVVYLNGTVIYRDSSLPVGPSYSTFANRTAAIADPAEDFFVHVQIDPALLLAGQNLLAVEVHQFSATDLDLSFNAQLIARYSPVPEPGALFLSIVAAGGLLGGRSARRLAARSASPAPGA